MSKTNLQQQITVQALPSKVWKVLTNAHYIDQYFADGNIISDWMEDSPVFLQKNEDTATRRTQIGRVIQSVPGILLKFISREENVPADIITTYELIVAAGGIELKMKIEGFNATYAEWLIRVQQANLLLQKIKWLCEFS